MTITFHAVHGGDDWAALKDDADLSQFREDSLAAWSFESRPKKTLSLMRTHDRVAEMNLKRGENGLFDPGAYRLAFALAFAQEHLQSWTDGTETVTNPTAEQVEDLPTGILLEYEARANGGLKVDSVKKPPPPSA